MENVHIHVFITVILYCDLSCRYVRVCVCVCVCVCVWSFDSVMWVKLSYL